MREFVNTLVIGQKAMLKTKMDVIVITFIVTASLLSLVTGVVLRETSLLGLSLSLAVIQLTNAYLMGRREQKTKP